MKRSILLNETKFDVIAITETHLHGEVQDIEVEIDGYSLFRKDRNSKLTTGEVYLCTIDTTYKLLNLTFPLTLSQYGLNSTSTLKNFSLLPSIDHQMINNL